MNDKIVEALDYIDDKYIADAAKRKKRPYRLIAAIAAILALVLFLRMPSIPLAISAKAVSLAADPRKTDRPDSNSAEYASWFAEQQQRNKAVTAAKTPIAAFFEACSKEVLTGTDSTNRVWSPINAYIALAMTAELTAGVTQQEVLDVLGVTQLPELREQISAVWEYVYQDNGKEISVLANSLWLDKDVNYHKDAMDLLSYHYYASVYRGDLGSEQTNQDIANWLNNQTGGLLKNSAEKVNLSENCMMALASTIYFQSQWRDQFDTSKSKQMTFHAASGDMECTFMNVQKYQMNYYWSEDYGAVQLNLKNGASMWLILPDEDKTVDDVLQNGDYAAMITNSEAFPEENQKWMKVNLSVPQFDVSASVDMKPALQKLGLTKIFEPLGNDFSPSVDSEIPVYLDNIQQNTRVAIDEEGVTAASYILLDFGAGSAMPPDEIIDFVLDRPFVFAITENSIPLFVGTVNTP